MNSRFIGLLFTTLTLTLAAHSAFANSKTIECTNKSYSLFFDSNETEAKYLLGKGNVDKKYTALPLMVEGSSNGEQNTLEQVSVLFTQTKPDFFGYPSTTKFPGRSVTKSTYSVRLLINDLTAEAAKTLGLKKDDEVAFGSCTLTITESTLIE